MLAPTETNLAVTERWLAQLERALSDCDDVLLKTLFHADSHWRDVLALTWRITTVNGRDAIVRELRTHGERARPVGFKRPPHRAAPRQTTRAGVELIEAIFTFETADGRGSGVVRLRPEDYNDNTPKAWTLLTALDEIKGHEERLGRSPRKVRRIPAISVGPIGSISDKPSPNTPTVIPPCWLLAEDRPDFQSPHASPNWASTR